MAIQKEAVKFRHKHLLGIQSLSIPEVNYILDESMQFVDFNKREQKKLNILTGKTHPLHQNETHQTRTRLDHDHQTHQQD